jgi:hypothetical protein
MAAFRREVFPQTMSEKPKPVYIPPFSEVRLVECRHHFQLVAVPKCRVVFGYGRIQSRHAVIDPEDPDSEPTWCDLKPDEEVWAVMQWYEFEDGHREKGSVSYLHPEVPESEVRKRMEEMEEVKGMSRQELLELSQCFEATEEDLDYIDSKRPNYQAEPNPSSTDEYDLYHARLKVLSELQPKTVELIKLADTMRDGEKRKFLERQAVQSYFAELAHHLTEDEVLAWQKTNPVGTGWLCEFGNVMQQPRRTVDPVNHELALNWLRARYNELTAGELSESIFKRRLTAAALKKRRERLGLTSKRPQGPRPKSEGP